MKKIAMCVVALVIMAGFVPVVFGADAASQPAVAGTVPPPPEPTTVSGPGQKYIDFEGKTLDGKDVKFSDLQGKSTTMLVFSNATCSTCRSEAQLISAAFGASKKADQVSLVYVMVDMTDTTAKNFVDTFKIQDIATVLWDPEFAIGPIYSVNFTPATFIVEDGKVTTFMRGFNPNTDKKTLNATLGKILF